MSSICKNNYNNYGSYLRSRGYNEQICSLVNDLNNGTVSLGSVVPGGVSGVTLKGTVNVNNVSPDDNGYLVINGGANTATTTFSIQANNGMKLAGPIVQTSSNVTYTGDNSYNSGNIFRGKNHIFTNNDGSSNVLIEASIYSLGALPTVSATAGSGTIDICANSTDSAGRLYFDGTWASGDIAQLTYTKPFSEKPVVVFSTEYGHLLDFSVNETKCTWFTRGDISGHLHYHTIGLKN